MVHKGEKMKITLEFLIEKEACKKGVEYFKQLKEQKHATDVSSLINHAIESNERKVLEWANWLIVRCFDKKQRVQYAIFSAQEVLQIFETKYPTDDRPRNAIKAAQYCIEQNFSDESVKASHSAAYAAHSAAYAASAAYVASSAASVASVASYVASSAASAASYVASSEKLGLWMVKRIKLLKPIE